MLKYMRMGNKRIKAVWWILTVITVVTFVFLFGTAFDPRFAHRAKGSVATVNGTDVTQQDYQTALSQTRSSFQRQYGSAPSEEDQDVIASQAWRTVVTQTLIGDRARQLGLNAHDAEIVTVLRTSPPPELGQLPDFQTNGQFDPNKYRAALGNTGINWSPWEQLVRDRLPGQKLQERLAASLKLSQPELLELYHGLSDSAAVTAVMIPPQMGGVAPKVSDADIDQAYEKYKNRMMTGAREQVEVLKIERQYAPEELRIAREQAQALADRARKGEDFAALARDYSEGAGSGTGGVINRTFQATDFGPYTDKMAASQKGQILDPLEESGRFIVFKVLDRVPQPGSPVPGIKLAQIIIKAQMSPESSAKQIAKLQKVRDRASQVGLGKAATEAGMATTKTAYFDVSNPPQQTFDIPEALDFALQSPKGALSPVLAGKDAFAVVQIADRQAAGAQSKAEVHDQLRQIAEFQKRVELMKPTVDRISAALKQGQTLENAATAAGQHAVKIAAMTRLQPDPRLGATPEVVGAIFGAPQGTVVGPIEAPTGWFFVRRDGFAVADTSRFDIQRKGQLSQQLLNQRQQEFFTAWLASVRANAKIEDLRPTAAASQQ